ncbi:30S ribosomal protein S21 [Candidatus Berkelbacteria bacterium]|nr:30S ribosomal protein S21 [Candidatus Berkelbacteria bacterium]
MRDKEKTSRDRSAPFDVILRRFFREVQQSRILSEVKKRRYHFKDPSRKMRRESARRKAARKRVKRGY